MSANLRALGNFLTTRSKAARMTLPMVRSPGTFPTAFHGLRRPPSARSFSCSRLARRDSSRVGGCHASAPFIAAAASTSLFFISMLLC